jgi:hypothetical protein
MATFAGTRVREELRGNSGAPVSVLLAGGELNVCYNCVDRHVDDRGDQIAIIHEGDEVRARV